MELLMVNKLTEKINDATGSTFIQATLVPVIAVGNNMVASSFDSGTRVFNPGKEPKIGDLFQGTIQHFNTTSYPIGDRTVNKITVVAGASENATDLANAQLKKHKACVLKADGTPTVKFKKIANPAEKEEVED